MLKLLGVIVGIGSCYVFLRGFPRSSRANISEEERKAQQIAGKSAADLATALRIGVPLEVRCGEQNH